jgi:hypothetical protein
MAFISSCRSRAGAAWTFRAAAQMQTQTTILVNTAAFIRAIQSDKHFAPRLYQRGNSKAIPARCVGIASDQAAIFSQLSVHLRHASTQLSMSPTRSQSSAHCLQISAHSRHVRLWCSVPISLKWADVLHISAQAIISLKCAGSTCLPPVSRQCPIAIDRHSL